jgi:hypothetical protein
MDDTMERGILYTGIQMRWASVDLLEEKGAMRKGFLTLFGSKD